MYMGDHEVLEGERCEVRLRKCITIHTLYSCYTLYSINA